GWNDPAGFAFLDMLVLVWPIGLAFATWTGASWLSTGELLAQFTSQYGNAAVIGQKGGGETGLRALVDGLTRTVLISPVLPLLLVVVIMVSIRRVDREPLLPMVMMVTVLVFQILTHALGSTFGLMR